jgi:hypothetical protein
MIRTACAFKGHLAAGGGLLALPTDKVLADDGAAQVLTVATEVFAEWQQVLAGTLPSTPTDHNALQYLELHSTREQPLS